MGESIILKSRRNALAPTKCCRCSVICVVKTRPANTASITMARRVGHQPDGNATEWVNVRVPAGEHAVTQSRPLLQAGLPIFSFMIDDAIRVCLRAN